MLKTGLLGDRSGSLQGQGESSGVDPQQVASSCRERWAEGSLLGSGTLAPVSHWLKAALGDVTSQAFPVSTGVGKAALVA